MKLIFVLFLSVMTLNSYSQNKTHSEMLEDFLQQRKKMMEEMMKAFEDDDFFKDDFLGDSFRNLKGFSGMGEKIKIEQNQKSDGKIEVVITPLQENIDMDIQTENNYITIKTKTRIEEKKEDGDSFFSSHSMSSSSRSIRIPDGYKASVPEAKGKSLLITLTPSAEMKKIVLPDSNGRVPVQKRVGEKSI